MAKKSSLVTRHLENISRDAIEKFPKLITEYIGKQRGIYALYSGNKLYYVGLATNLRSRLQQHLKDRHGDSWDRFSVYLTISDTHIKELESLLLRVVNPHGNKVKGSFAKSENLKRKFTSDIKKKQQLELNKIVGQGTKRKSPAAKTKRKVAAKTESGESTAATKRSLAAKKAAKTRAANKTKAPSAAAKRSLAAQKAAKTRAANKAKATKSSPALAPYADQLPVIKGKYGNKWIRARVLKDGTISRKGERFATPSGAAVAVCGQNMNGWLFWHYENKKGDWVPLDALRK